LTDKIEEEAWNYINRIEDMGGMVKAIEKGYVQKEIQDSAYKYQKSVEAGDRVVVGVNKFALEEAPPSGLLKVNPKLQKIQEENLKQVRSERDNAKVEDCLAALSEGASKENVNLMPLIIDSVREYATLGEISNVLRDKFGEYRESIVL
jgi:methylmalonyl-CoA mutase N-terminal domain/subunit